MRLIDAYPHTNQALSKSDHRSLTTGVDTGAAFTGTAGNDTFNAADTTATTWTVGDAIDGGAGKDTFNVVRAAAIADAPTGSSVKNVETANISSGATVVLNTTTWTGLESLTSTSVAGNTVTAAATTDVTVVESSQASSGTSQTIVNGGKNVTVNATGTTANASAFTAADGTGAEILIGATTAAAGDVIVNSTFKSATDDAKSGDIFVKGGKTVTVNQSLTNSTVNVTNIQGAVSVVGDANTTAVTVNQSATAAESGTGLGVVGKTAGAVTIKDKNAASATAAGTITTVTLNNAGTASINSGALTTLNLAGTIAGVDAGTLGGLTTAANSTLALNLTGAKQAAATALVIDTDIKTLNVSGNTTASTITSLDAQGAQKINVSGDAKVTFTANTTGAVTDIVVTNTAGAAFGTAIGAAVNFTGGVGADSVKLSDSFTKAITMGAGNDTVTIGGTTIGTGGSVSGGDGTDTLKMTAAQAVSLDDDSTFNSKFSGFEALELTTSNAQGASLDLDGINGVSSVKLADAVDAGFTINNLVSGGTVTITTNGANTPVLTVGVKGALLGAADTLNLNLSKTGAVLAAGKVVAANVETVNIVANDAAVAPTPGSAANINTLELAATSATTVTVAGNNGLTLTNTGNTKIVNFDASGVVANDTVDSAGYAATTDTAANLAVTFASANTTATANVSIKGGAGDDTLSGTVAKDTISGGAGADRIYSDNAGTKRSEKVTIAVDVGGGTTAAGDIVKTTVLGKEVTFTLVAGSIAAADGAAGLAAAINADTALAGLVTASAAAAVVTINYLVDGNTAGTATQSNARTTATAAQITAGTAGTTAVDVIDGGAGADLIVGGGGTDTLTGGAGVDTFFFLKAHSNQAALATITDYTYAVGGASNDKINLGDVATAAGTKTTVQDLSSSATLAAAFNAAALSNTVDNGLVAFIYGGDTYVMVETTGATSDYVAGDFAVKLVGTPVVAGTALAGLGFDAV